MVFNGTITGTPALATGSGTENDPYQISTAEGLKWFRDKVNNAKTPDETKICAVLTADIDLNNEEWTPIGPSESSAYTGTFDGQGHTVRNLSITGDVKRAGLFGCVIGGAIRKLTVAGSVSCTVDQGWRATLREKPLKTAPASARSPTQAKMPESAELSDMSPVQVL